MTTPTKVKYDNRPIYVDKNNADNVYFCGNDFVSDLLKISSRTLQRYKGKGVFGDMDPNCTRYPYKLIARQIRARITDQKETEDPNKELTRAKTVKMKIEIQEKLKELIPLSYAGYISSDIVRKLYRTIRDVIVSSDDIEEDQKQKLLASIEIEARAFQKDEKQFVEDIISTYGTANA